VLPEMQDAMGEEGKHRARGGMASIGMADLSPQLRSSGS
jgi:hypothetical protein